VSDASWGQAVATVFLGLVGLWLAHNYRRQIRLKLAERQVDSYIRLWKLTASATPERTTPLDHVERQRTERGWSFPPRKRAEPPNWHRSLPSPVAGCGTQIWVICHAYPRVRQLGPMFGRSR
jgi:hypothetical protein